MPYKIAELFKTITNTAIDDISGVINTATTPARIACNDLQAVLIDAETSSMTRLQKSLTRAEVYRRFLAFKNHFATSPDRDGKYVYYYLSSIEVLPYPQNEQLIWKATAFIDAEPELARQQIGGAMVKLSQNSMLAIEQQQTLAMVC